MDPKCIIKCKHIIKLGSEGRGQSFITQILVQSLGELVQGWWNLQPLLENPLLPLDADHLRPSKGARAAKA